MWRLGVAIGIMLLGCAGWTEDITPPTPLSFDSGEVAGPPPSWTPDPSYNYTEAELDQIFRMLEEAK